MSEIEKRMERGLEGHTHTQTHTHTNIHTFIRTHRVIGLGLDADSEAMIATVDGSQTYLE